MVMQMRKVLKELYPDRFGSARKPAEAPGKNLLGGLLIKKPKLNGGHFSRITKRHLVCAAAISLVTIQAFVIIYYYNKFLTMESDVHAAKSQVDVQLQRRKNLVAELNAIVVSYAKHEKGIFELGIDTRKDMVRSTPPAAAKDGKAQNQGAKFAIPGLTADSPLSKLLAVGESFPGLRLSENYQRLMDALVEVETTIADKRMELNHKSNEMATATSTFPAVWYNRVVLHYKVPQFYAADADVDKPVKLDLPQQ